MANIIPIYIPTYISDENYQPTRVLPRLLFYNGQVECEGYWLQNELSQQFEQSTFPYFDNYNVVTGSFPTVNSKSLLFYNEEASYGQTPTASLYSEYWSTYLNLLYNPITKLINASAIIPLADYRELKQNDIVEFRGNYYHLRAINDYSLKNGECTLQLLGPILVDSLNLETVYYEYCMGYDAVSCSLACANYYSTCGVTFYYEYCMGYSATNCTDACNNYIACPIYEYCMGYDATNCTNACNNYIGCPIYEYCMGYSATNCTDACNNYIICLN